MHAVLDRHNKEGGTDLRRFITLLGLAGFASTAHAVDCPWSNQDAEAYATWSEVVVNGTHYPVSGMVSRGRFMSLLAACDASEASQYFNEWRNSRETGVKYQFLAAFLSEVGNDPICPWTKDDVVAYANLRNVWVDDIKYKAAGPKNRGQFLSTLLSCQEDDAARSFNGWRGSRKATNISAITIIGLVYTPVSAVGSGYFKNKMLIELMQESESRSGGITGSG